MAQQTINIGTAPNDGTGDALRTAGGKINDNFTELYTATAGAGDIKGPGSSIDNAVARFDATTGKLIQNSPLIVADTTGALSRSGGGGVPVQGTNTNDNATAGNTGEYISDARVVGSATVLTINVAVNVASITLSPGDWDVRGNVTFQGGGSVSTLLQMVGSISNTSATLDSSPGRYSAQWLGSGTDLGNSNANTVVGPARISVDDDTTVYLVGRASFTGNAVKAFGILEARRAR